MRIKRLWKICRYLMQAKMVWSWPRKSEVLILDGSNKDILLEYVEPWHPEVLYVRGEQTNIMEILKSLLRRGEGYRILYRLFYRKSTASFSGHLDR
jgi:surface carbohydrate biosynthesis protein